MAAIAAVRPFSRRGVCRGHTPPTLIGRTRCPSHRFRDVRWKGRSDERLAEPHPAPGLKQRTKAARGCQRRRARWPLRRDPVVFRPAAEEASQPDRPAPRPAPPDRRLLAGCRLRTVERRSALDAQTILELLQQGGLTVYPLALGSILVLAIFIERLWRFRGIDRGTRTLTRDTIECARAPRPRWRAHALREVEDPDRGDLPRGDALEERRARGSRARARDLAPGGGARSEARPLDRRHDRLAGAVRRPVRHRGRHHPRLPRHGGARRGRLRGRGGGHLRGADRDRRGPRRRDRRAALLQLPADARRPDRRDLRALLRALRAGAALRRIRRPARRPAERRRSPVGASFRPRRRTTATTASSPRSTSRR